MFNNDIFSERLYLLRNQASVSQKTLADYIGISYQAIGKIEKKKGAASIEVIFAIAEYFNVSIDYLTGRTDNPSMSNIIVEQKLSEEETELLEDFRLLDKLEKNIVIGKIAEFNYNKEVEKNNHEMSDELVEVNIKERLNR